MTAHRSLDAIVDGDVDARDRVHIVVIDSPRWQNYFGESMHQVSWSRRWRRRSCWCEDHEVARARLMIAPIIGRNELVADWGESGR